MDHTQDGMRTGGIWQPLARAIAATGTEEHVDRLIDLIGAEVPHDLVTVTRYSATSMPEFVKHRRFSDEMVRRYLASYYIFDPFYACWRRERRLGIVPLRTLADDEVKRGQYIAEFLAHSQICDEVGILLADGGDWCLGIFLDRSTKPFRDTELALLRERLPVFASLHALDLKARGPEFSRTSALPAPGASPRREPCIPEGLWPELSQRERELVPGDAAASHHDPLPGAAHHQATIRVPAHARVLPAQRIAVSPVGGGVEPLQQAGAGQQRGAGAGRGQQGPLGMALANPVRGRVVHAVQLRARRDREVGDAHDVGPGAAGERGLRHDAHTVGGGERLAVGRNDQRPEGGPRRAAMDHLPVAPDAAQRVVKPVQRGSGHVGDRQQRDDDGPGRFRHGTNVLFLAENTLVQRGRRRETSVIEGETP